VDCIISCSSSWVLHQGAIYNKGSMKHSISEWKSLTINLLSLGWPNVITYLVGLSLPVCSSLMVGHLGDPAYMGAASLAVMLANATGFSVGLGMAMGLDTLCSQAFGAKQYKLVGLYCQRAALILTLLCFPIALVWLQAEKVLKLMGVEDEIAAMSLKYIMCLIPGMWPNLMFEIIKRYLQCQRITWPPTVTVMIVAAVHLVISYLFVMRLDFGFLGAAYATSISNWLLFIVSLSIVRIRSFVLKRRKRANSYLELELEDKGSSILQNSTEIEDGDYDTWPSMWSLDIVRGWPGYLKYGAPAAASLFIEWGSFEVNAAISANLGSIPLAAHSVVVQTAGLWYTPPLGIAISASALVGNMLGANEPEIARMYTVIALVLEAMWGFINGGIGMIYRNQLGRMFTTNEDVIRLTASMISILWLYGFLDALKCVGGALLRGCGRPAITLYGNILACLVVGYPVAFLLTFKFNMGLHGVWLGMSSAWFVASCGYIYVILRTKWQVEADKVTARNKQDAEMNYDKSGDVAIDEKKGDSLAQVYISVSAMGGQ